MDAPSWQVQVLDDKISEVMKHEDLQLVSLADTGPALLGRILRCRGERIVLEKLRSLGREFQENLRMPVYFESFIYPISGRWKGRRGIESNDLSCGGISFFCREELADGERVEMVIPVKNSILLLLRCQVLRRRPSDREEGLYAAKFLDLCRDEEMLVREAVFNVQLQNRHQFGLSVDDARRANL